MKARTLEASSERRHRGHVRSGVDHRQLALDDRELVFTEVSVQGSIASVRYRYDVEGIRGTVSLSKSAHDCDLKNSRVVEH